MKFVVEINTGSSMAPIAACTIPREVWDAVAAGPLTLPIESGQDARALGIRYAEVVEYMSAHIDASELPPFALNHFARLVVVLVTHHAGIVVIDRNEG